MFGNLLAKVFGTKTQRDLKTLQPYIDQVREHYPRIEALSDDGLRTQTALFRQRLSEAVRDIQTEIDAIQERLTQTEALEEREQLFAEREKRDKELGEQLEKELEAIRPEAFAVVVETARRWAKNGQLEVEAGPIDRSLSQRDFVHIEGDKAIWPNRWKAAGNEIVWDMVHYDVQLIGGTVLHQGKIAEMATGEGKTLMATLAVYLNALTGRGVHLVTVNDYLARRDSEWMGPLYQFHGLTVDCIDRHQPNSPERRTAYQADITYGTNNEFGFDYLRDNMARSPEDMVQRKHNFAIVDEVDSVLIDDARTPLIISGPTPKGEDQDFDQLKPFVVKLFQAQRAVVQQELIEAKRLIDQGDDKEGGVRLLRAHRGLPKNKALIKFLSEEGRKTLLQKTENYYLQEQGKEMWKIDQDLFFVIDEKQNQVELTEKGIELLSGDTDPQFFILPDLSIEVARIDREIADIKDRAERKEALLRDFEQKSERIHTMNQLLKAYTLFERDVEYVVMENKVKIVDEQTGRIMEGRRYSDGLHQAIEAKESVKIEAATQTYATITLQNYFRMYAKLAGMTGTAETEAQEFWNIYKLEVVVIPTNRPIVREDEEDLVYKTKREKYNAVIEEIEKLTLAGRPVLVGTTSVEISELLSRSLKLRKINHNVLNAKLHQKEAEIVQEAGKPSTVTIATNMAGRGTDIKLTPESKAAGGLAIIGTERHDSRRVDRQLRGRSGRQGDPGSSQFFVSLEDNLMRLFGSERIAGLMDKMGLKEGEVIQHSMVTKSIERAQRKVEENNFGVRKRLLEYDDVMNSQREVIYARRRNALFGDKLATDLANILYDTASALAAQFVTTKNEEELKFELFRVFGLELPSDIDLKKPSESELAERFYAEARKHYEDKSERMASSAFPVIKDVYENQKGQYQNIVVPFTDGVKMLQVVTNIETAYSSKGKQLVRDFEKNITLLLIDEAWKEHLRKLDDLRQYVQGAVYEQKDPLLIYKFESFELFKAMVTKLNAEILSFLFKSSIPIQQNPARPAAPGPIRRPEALQTSGPGAPDSAAQRGSRPVAPRPQPVRTAPVVNTGKKYGRNDMVTLRNIQTGEQRSAKYKVAEPLLNSGAWVVED
ncbi:preprotein translocase subunit SecA [bacterium]|nr:preprotein translocase subunit SecA [bacterium]